MSTQDLDFVAPLVIEYMRFVGGRGGISREELLRRPLTGAQRRLLTDRMDDVDYLNRVVVKGRDAVVARTGRCVPAHN